MSARDEPSYLAFARAAVRRNETVSGTIAQQLVARIDRDASALKATQPRTITTAKGLAEAHMVVVRTAAGTIANLVNGRTQCFGYEASAPVDTLTLPMTVLWDREATA
jgi:hypothetical protein